jgi:N-acetyl-alpha-D-glucosaminyl L-malate synthase BshA
VVTTLHGTDTTLLGNDPGYEPIIHHSLMKSDAITTVSDFLAAETRRVFRMERDMHVIHNFFEPGKPSRSRESVRQELGVADDEVLIIHSSNLRPVKRIDLLLATMARAKQLQPNLKLLVLAGGDFTPFAAEAERLGIRDSIIVRENVVEIEDYLQAADLSLYTSETESFCLSILEAMCFGAPAVASRVGGIPEVVEDGRTGILVEFGNVDGLAAAVARLAADKQLRAEMGAASRERARARFTAQAIVPKYERLYYDMVATAKTRHLENSELEYPDAEHACR